MAIMDRSAAMAEIKAPISLGLAVKSPWLSNVNATMRPMTNMVCSRKGAEDVELLVNIANASRI